MWKRSRLPARRRRAVRRRKMVRRKVARAPSTEYASLKETVTTTVNANTVNYFSGFGLADLALTRAPRVGANYQHFKITRIDCKILTAFDTYPGGGAVRMPQVYWVANKGESIPPGLGFNELLNLGAKPRVLNEKNCNFRFKPAVVIGDKEGAAIGAAQPKISPWLDTNSNPGGAYGPSNTEHSGVILGVLPMAAGDLTQYQVQFTYHFKFRKPLVLVYGDKPVEGTTVIHKPMVA